MLFDYFMLCRYPEKFFEDLKVLTIRHIKYGVKADYVKPFGKVGRASLRC
jgi:hypothetical protein